MTIITIIFIITILINIFGGLIESYLSYHHCHCCHHYHYHHYCHGHHSCHYYLYFGITMYVTVGVVRKLLGKLSKESFRDRRRNTEGIDACRPRKRRFVESQVTQHGDDVGSREHCGVLHGKWSPVIGAGAALTVFSCEFVEQQSLLGCSCSALEGCCISESQSACVQEGLQVIGRCSPAVVILQLFLPGLPRGSDLNGVCCRGHGRGKSKVKMMAGACCTCTAAV